MNELTTLVAQTPCGINHIVLNVRDMDMAHWFWTECLGFKHVATSAHVPGDGSRPMRFYSGEVDGKLRHHDIALVERAASDGDTRSLNHVAIAYPTEAAFEQQIAFLLAQGVALHRRVDRGVTRSIHMKDPDGNEIELVHELPREVWEGDIEAALNHAVELNIGE
jgi:catechol 2,3-dioxygenase